MPSTTTVTGLSGTVVAAPMSSASLDIPSSDPFRSFFVFSLVVYLIAAFVKMLIQQSKAERVLKKLPGRGKDMSLLTPELQAYVGQISGLTGGENIIVFLMGVGMIVVMYVIP